MVSESLTKEQLETIKDMKITVIGQAVQTAGFDNDADNAWEAFEKQFEK